MKSWKKLFFILIVTFLSNFCFADNIDGTPKDNQLTESSTIQEELLLYPVTVKGKMGYINNKGELIIQPIYEKASEFINGLAYVEQKKQQQIINQKGEVIGKMAPKTYLEDGFYEGLALYSEKIKKEKKYGYVDTTGKIIIKAKYEQAYRFNESLAVVLNKTEFKEGDQFDTFFWDVIDRKEKKINKKPFQLFISGNPIYFQEGMLPIDLGDAVGSETVPECGYLNNKGDIVISNLEFAEGFSCGVAAVKKDDLYGYIDKTGKWVIENKYNAAYSFSNGIAIVYEYNREMSQIIDTKGKVLYETNTAILSNISGDRIIFQDNKSGLYGMMDRKYNIVLQPTYNNRFSFQSINGLAKVEKTIKKRLGKNIIYERKHYLINNMGEIVWSVEK